MVSRFSTTLCYSMCHIMTELHERFTDGLFEARWQPDAQPEGHKGENNRGYRAEEQRSEADKLKQIKIELLNMPFLALEMPGSKVGTRPIFLDIIAIILAMIS
jgi:hypothetical protein